MYDVAAYGKLPASGRYRLRRPEVEKQLQDQQVRTENENHRAARSRA